MNSAQASDELPATKMIRKVGKKFRGEKGPGRHQKTTWKVNFEDYLYKRFHPMRAEKYPYKYPKMPEIGGTVVYPVVRAGRDRFGGHRCIFRCRFFSVDPKHERRATVRCQGGNARIADWRGYEVLRADVKAVGKTVIHMGIIDTVIQPPVVGVFNLDGGKWFTLELDLEQAVKDRQLDLAKMCSMWMYADAFVAGDYANVRLEKRSVKPKHPVLKDAEATKLPAMPEKAADPQPDIKPNLAPLKVSKTLTFDVGHNAIVYKVGGHTNGAAAVFDQNNVFFIFGIKKSYLFQSPKGQGRGYDSWRNEFFAAQTLDGGKTWKGLGEDEKPTHLIHDRATHHILFDDRGGIIEWNNNGCGSGPAGPWHRIRKYSFAGSKGWTRWDKDRVLDEEARHCTHGAMSFVRAPDGRIWGALGIEGRWYPNAVNIHAKVSDTDGKHWATWQPGFTGRIPGMSGQAVAGIAPYRDHVAVFSKVPQAWTWFDGKQWAKPMKLPTKYIYSALSVGREDLFLGTSLGVLHWEGKEWKTELKNRVSLCKSGNTLMAFAFGKNPGVYHRSPDGKWEGPEKLEIEPALEVHVPRFCPPNLGAVVYVPKANPKSIKVLMVPNKFWKGE